MLRTLIPLNALIGLAVVMALLAAGAMADTAAEQNSPDNPAQIIADVRSRAAAIDTLVAQFKQIRDSKLLQAPLVSEGLIYFQRYEGMLTQINTPSALQLLIKDRYLTIVNPELGTVIKRRMSRSDQIIKTWLQGDIAFDALSEQYDLQLTRTPHHEHYNLHMLPRDRQIARHIERVEIEIDTATLLPERIMIHTAKGDRTLVLLQFLAINEPLPAGIFDITLPEMFPDDR